MASIVLEAVSFALPDILTVGDVHFGMKNPKENKEKKSLADDDNQRPAGRSRRF